MLSLAQTAEERVRKLEQADTEILARLLPPHMARRLIGWLADCAVCTYRCGGDLAREQAVVGLVTLRTPAVR